MINVFLKVPRKDQLVYRHEWMNDSDTMEYNAGYDMKVKGYNKQTGTISKTKEEMLEWYDKWTNQEPDRFFAYIYDLNFDFSLKFLAEKKYLNEYTELVCRKFKSEKIHEQTRGMLERINLVLKNV